ncbi:DEAD/DEAH box helicase [Paludicola sp. MB14-C6]|uniref:DEAD/DEAH box helicase n=1 Tax=Paludihabitans sp. MB14-C6 TaxID=3070656 RepID=UPI0027DD4E64|nr:DEAD/DEAH box helicase [Paludicola sp. MB14-C6]WMJ23957.1 DEAD/DEAH box helicase [Paludicola sp. MB14-C6]
MNELSFQELNLTQEMQRAIDEMGFETATGIQSEAIPLIRTGADVIGRSQTGTGKTVAFSIPALEMIDTVDSLKNSLQVLILCPTRELAQQACEEIHKLTKYMHGIRAVEVYGGVPMDRQIVRLRKANIVIGTPGRVMDHMRRRTLKLDHLKMIILDEADEMLSMGFKEDIETILQDTPEQRQTILFSATMPPAILALTKQFQTDPQIVEINKKQVTLNNIEQLYIDAPMGRKMDALNLMLRYYDPKLAMIFCNTKRMVDEITEYLNKNGFAAEGLHGDMKQSQRTKVMDSFKFGKTAILVATDVAARGIDVNNIDYVINYDIPQNTEYYVHRIGRTGRAGKSGIAITICSGRRQVYTLRDIARSVKSEIKLVDIPSTTDIHQKSLSTNLSLVEQELEKEISDVYVQMVNDLLEKGHTLPEIAAAALQMQFDNQMAEIAEIKSANRGNTRDVGGNYGKIVINIGRDSRVAPNHIVAAISERTNLSGNEIGKIEIFDDKTIVSIPSSHIEEVLDGMVGCKICGKPTVSSLMEGKPRYPRKNGSNNNRGGRKPDYRKKPRYNK